MTMLSLSRRLGITPRADQEDDPAAAGWLDGARPEGGQPALVPQQWAGTRAVRDRERANYSTEDHATGEYSATARGPHPLGSVDPAAAALTAPGPTLAALLAETQSFERPTAAAQRDEAWPEICDQYGSHMLVLAEQLRASINVLEAGEDDPERLQRLYQVDHAVARMRLASRQLRTLAGRSEQRIAGFTTSLLDVIRMASSAIEWYPQVSVGRVTDLAVLGYAADDVAALMSALLDNATRYSPDMVTVSCHLLEEGGVMFRVEDTGSGFGQDQLARLNVALAGPVPDVTESTGRHTGFPVVHRIARKHSIVVRLASRSVPSHGTVAMVTLPPQLLCAIPVEDPPRRSSPARSAAAGFAAAGPAAWPAQATAPAQTQAAAPSAVSDPPRRERTGLSEPVPPEMVPPEMVPPEMVSREIVPAEPVSAELVSAEPVSREIVSAETVPAELVPAVTVSTELVSAVTVSTELVPAVSAELVPAEPDHDRLPVPLPRREPASLRGDKPRPVEAAAPVAAEQAAARRIFADDLSAFSQGIQDALAARGITNASSAILSARSDGAATSEPEGTAIEEGARS
jgi:Histidine kinase-, DNA gyrase B-, and HSP90-like ATPase